MYDPAHQLLAHAHLAVHSVEYLHTSESFYATNLRLHRHLQNHDQHLHD